MSWEDVHRAMDENRGTLLEEWYSFKGPVRYWWTAENAVSYTHLDVYKRQAFAIVDEPIAS